MHEVVKKLLLSNESVKVESLQWHKRTVMKKIFVLRKREINHIANCFFSFAVLKKFFY